MSSPRTITPLQRLIAARVRQLRMSRGLTQEQVAEAAGVSPEAVHRYEAARLGLTIPVLERLAQIFRVPVGALVSDPAAPAGHEEHELLERFRRLDVGSRRIVLELAAHLHEMIHGRP